MCGGLGCADGQLSRAPFAHLRPPRLPSRPTASSGRSCSSSRRSPLAVPAAGSATSPTTALDRALERFVARADGPPGIAVVVQSGAEPELHVAGTAVVGREQPATLDDHTRVASVAKAYSGATALALVSAGTPRPRSHRRRSAARACRAPGRRSPSPSSSSTPAAWPTSRSRRRSEEALVGSLLVPPPPVDLVMYVADDPLLFAPGTRYHYSNTDNILVGLMVEAASGHTYPDELQIARRRAPRPGPDHAAVRASTSPTRTSAATTSRTPRRPKT